MVWQVILGDLIAEHEQAVSGPARLSSEARVRHAITAAALRAASAQVRALAAGAPDAIAPDLALSLAIGSEVLGVR